jgi:hypothetical protein
VPPAPPVVAPNASTSAVEETPDPGDDAPSRIDDESFENAVPTELPRADIEPAPASPVVANGQPEVVVARQAPPLEDIVQKLPPETRRALDELFRARFTTVRRIKPEQLR